MRFSQSLAHKKRQPGIRLHHPRCDINSTAYIDKPVVSNATTITSNHVQIYNGTSPRSALNLIIAHPHIGMNAGTAKTIIVAPKTWPPTIRANLFSCTGGAISSHSRACTTPTIIPKISDITTSQKTHLRAPRLSSVFLSSGLRCCVIDTPSHSRCRILTHRSAGYSFLSTMLITRPRRPT